MCVYLFGCAGVYGTRRITTQVLTELLFLPDYSSKINILSRSLQDCQALSCSFPLESKTPLSSMRLQMHQDEGIVLKSLKENSRSPPPLSFMAICYI